MGEEKEVILNLTLTPATPEQIEQGVIDTRDGNGLRWITRQLTFTEFPTVEELEQRAARLALFAMTKKVKKAMIEGPFFLIPFLVLALKKQYINPVFSFSVQDEYPVVERIDTGVKKITGETTFKHVGFIEV